MTTNEQANPFPSETHLFPQTQIDNYVRKILLRDDSFIQEEPFVFDSEAVVGRRDRFDNLNQLRSALFFPVAMRATAPEFAEEAAQQDLVSTKTVTDAFEDDWGNISAYRILPVSELDNNKFLFHLMISVYSGLNYGKKHIDPIDEYDELELSKNLNIASTLEDTLTIDKIKTIMREIAGIREDKSQPEPSLQMMYYNANWDRKKQLQGWEQGDKKPPFFLAHALQAPGSGYTVRLANEEYQPFAEKGLVANWKREEIDYAQLDLPQEIISEAENTINSDEQLLAAILANIQSDYATQTELAEGESDYPEEFKRRILAGCVGRALKEATLLIATGMFMPSVIEKLEELASKNLNLLSE